ncbi:MULTISPECIES: ArsR/SmtB family transcription factor [unclassified Gilliamella]|uniref:ArsR/SmtB family transcription factor n=1 Tax=unclassified Gilliamella TaxID=2685620 RepID=UPI00226AFB12|nr:MULTISPECIES: metalloregulator ArsR/SmtB family transcription factor [unclassified Gilliamella]MCX8588517.1 helix-turn-helix transcriptional regulator [Gilliamella sp. B3801]MCX8592955.1 helix-turn-helix transcriptional regulator [Gilliamella sp. B3804]
MNTTQAAKYFECISSPTRLDIFSLLIRYGSEGLVAGEIATKLGLPASNLSFHLKALTHCQLISVVQEGRFLRYRANLSLMKNLASYLTQQCCIAQSGKTDCKEEAI